MALFSPLAVDGPLASPAGLGVLQQLAFGAGVGGESSIGKLLAARSALLLWRIGL
jgi:hypothetical protein